MSLNYAQSMVFGLVCSDFVLNNMPEDIANNSALELSDSITTLLTRIDARIETTQLVYQSDTSLIHDVFQAFSFQNSNSAKVLNKLIKSSDSQHIIIASRLAVTSLTSSILNNNAPENYFTEIWNTASGISEEFDMTIRKIGHVLGWGSENHAMRHLGTGEKYDEVATLALYCILQHPNSYLSAVKCASKASQNSAMITQLVGLLMGLKLGVHALPVVWVEHCQNRKYILKLTEKLNNHRIR